MELIEMRKPIGRADVAFSILEPVKGRIVRDWLNGVSELAIASMYEIRRKHVEQILRERLAGSPRGGDVVRMRRSA